MMTGLKDELHRLDVSVLIEYSVHEADKSRALAVYERFRNNPAALRLLRCYYADLPEAREEMVVDLKVAAEKQGSMLAVLQTPERAYLYLLADDQAVFLQEYAEGLTDASILSYFEFSSADDFRKKTGRDPARLPSLAGDGSDAAATCVACGVKAGEFHVLGCPVEPCPWCESQLSRCNCRFEQLGVASIEDDHQLDRFEELLEAKGRFPFSTEQNPSYPVAGDDPPPCGTEKK
ncbi:MAG: hypothetical protein LJE64_02730 [Desulfofustis sp.]|nr:hypothetical protein [Desulfofustis sp.]